MRRSLLIAPLLWLLALPAWSDARMTVLVDLLDLREVAAILRQEGQAHASTLNQEMLGGQGGPGWQMQVDTIYDPDRMVEMVRRALEETLQDDALEAAIAFYSSDLGGQVIEMENAARAAISEGAVEDAARERFAELDGTDDPRLAQITQLLIAGDMIDRNVSTALNSNFQFLKGLRDGGALADSEEDLLADVSADLDRVTEDTRAWLYAYMLLAYHPLDDAALSRYIEFAQSEAGRAVNRGLFKGFGKAYEDISYALGRTVALNMTAEEL
ncbi:DUF2059 domain-containing protein [Sulfitobacter sp. S0837]|uniref:DUF2059 domain-containing protein n=1 Tax=Sulfitobacter maritimus TaxID=2741719 RepID=UPI0015829B9D|nr:DUF2059 domain-containing protein [Sulfitobacter maritimus]NUH64234.1 DUF2059 domain-containing protein [Sulfitobacter maritimus]